MLRRIPFSFVIPLAILLVIALLPYIWILLASFKRRVDLITPNPKWIFDPTTINFVDIFERGFDTYLLNSIIMAARS